MDDKVTDDFIHDKYGWCYYAIEKNNTSAIVYNLFTEPEYRRQGHAKRHLQIVINKIRVAGYAGKIMVEVKPSNKKMDIKRLSDFYTTMGLSVITSRRQAQAAPKSESVQSAGDIVEEICLLSTSGYIDWREQAAKLIAAQRQAGREEVQRKYNSYVVDLINRYAAIVEAAKVLSAKGGKMTRVTGCGSAVHFFDMTAQTSGISIQCDATTLIGAKREASKWMAYGGGSIVLHDRVTHEMWTREFWESGSLFGWGRWTRLPA